MTANDSALISHVAAARSGRPTAADERVSVTVLGAGSVVTEYYLPALAATGMARTLTICDLDAEGLSQATSLMPEADVVATDFRELLSRPPPIAAVDRELVIVALPNHLHIEACELALRPGRRVLCEKPLSLSVDECRHVSDLAATNASALDVAMVRRYLPSWRLARDVIRAGEIGAITSVEVNDRAPFGWRPRALGFFAPSAGGILADIGVHYLDFLEWVLGPLTPQSYTDDWVGGTESSCSYQLRAGASEVRVELSRTHRGRTDCVFTGERGTLRIDKACESHIVVQPAGAAPRRVTFDAPFTDARWPHSLHGAFCQMLRDQQRSISGVPSTCANAGDAERTGALIEWAYAQRSGRRASAPAASDEKAEVLVTGATGFIGGHLIERLAGSGSAVECLVRSPATVANLARFNVRLTQASILDRAALDRAVAGKSRVFHLAYGRDEKEAAQVTIEGTKQIVEAAIAAGVEAVVVLSTAYVFGFPDGSRPVDESFPYRPYGGAYGTTKAEMERWCLDRARSSGSTRIVVLNPTNVIGPGGGAYTTLPVELARAGTFCWVDGGRGICNYTYVGNTVDAIVAAAASREAHGQRFIINDGARPWTDVLGPLVAAVAQEIPSYTAAELEALAGTAARFRLNDLGRAIVASREVRAVARRSRLVQKISKFKLLRRMVRPEGAGPVLPSWATTAGSEPQHAAPPSWLAGLYHTHETVFSAERARNILGWTPQIDLTTAQALTLAWLAQAGYLDTAGMVERR